MEYIATTADDYLVCNTVEAVNRARGAINGKQSHIRSPYDPQNTLNKTEIASKFDIKKDPRRFDQELLDHHQCYVWLFLPSEDFHSATVKKDT